MAKPNPPESVLHSSRKTIASPTEGATSDDGSDDLPSIYSGQLVRFYVGRKRQKYLIYLNAICDASSSFKESIGVPEHQKPFLDRDLPDHDAGAFKLLRDFFYAKSFDALTRPAQPKGSQPNRSTMDAADAANMNRLLNLYFMADDWHLRDLKNTCIDHLRSYTSRYQAMMGATHVAKIYEKLKREDDPLRRYVVDAFVFLVTRKNMVKKDRQFYIKSRSDIDYGQFICDVIEAMSDERNMWTRLPRGSVSIILMRRGRN
ncbi:MAG: hypothetical protein L6R42_008078 [Xanthoria sp. 1 TBL-2021]|nr:MAG: hypothetical protein L6R42_008078 [Xanthoria sp. 1 TBL-2021]